MLRTMRHLVLGLAAVALLQIPVASAGERVERPAKFWQTEGTYILNVSNWPFTFYDYWATGHETHLGRYTNEGPLPGEENWVNPNIVEPNTVCGVFYGTATCTTGDRTMHNDWRATLFPGWFRIDVVEGSATGRIEGMTGFLIGSSTITNVSDPFMDEEGNVLVAFSFTCVLEGKVTY